MCYSEIKENEMERLWEEYRNEKLRKEKLIRKKLDEKGKHNRNI